VQCIICLFLFVFESLLVPDKLDGAGSAASVQAVVVGHDLVALGVGEKLIAAHAVAVLEAEVLAALAAHCVEALVVGRVPDVAQVEVVERQLGLGVNVLQVPPGGEGKALRLSA
jgi:hypothetical protein